MSGTAVIGAGPAGLTAAWELSRLGIEAIVLEKDDVVGGISRTVRYGEYRFDIGGHRFFTKVPEVQELWEELLGEDLLERPRLSRIYYAGRFFHYPLRPLDALVGLGALEAVRVAASYGKAQLFPLPEERNFEQWVVNRFGRRLYEIFFETYTEKVWGMPCSEIGAEWASQRIKNLDLATAVKNALLGAGGQDGGLVTTLIDRFHYPRLGPGMMWERCRDVLEEKGVATLTDRRVTRLEHDGERVRAIEAEDGEGRSERWEVDHVIASLPLGEAVRSLDPAPAPEALEAAARLRHRDFLTIGLIVDREHVFPDNWIYVHAPEVRMGRIQNFKNWSPAMVPDPSKTSLGLEYFVQRGDELWSMDDEELVRLGARECGALGLLDPEEVLDGTVIRMPRAYPVYDATYREAVARLRAALEPLRNLQIVGRNGQHRYNNQDHSMLAGMLAARNVAGARHDVWAVNVDTAYHEQGRATPRPAAAATVEELIREAFARYDPVALGGAVGVVGGLGLFLATALLLLRGGETVGPNLSLLGNYLYGFDASWRGAVVGAAEAGVGGFGLGYLLARSINAMVGWYETGVRRSLELTGALDPLGGGDR